MGWTIAVSAATLLVGITVAPWRIGATIGKVGQEASTATANVRTDTTIAIQTAVDALHRNVN